MLSLGCIQLSARVQHWRNGQMVLRWTCATAIDAAKCFHRIKGRKGIPKLFKALYDHDHYIGLEPSTQAAEDYPQRRLPHFNSAWDSACIPSALK